MLKETLKAGNPKLLPSPASEAEATKPQNTAAKGTFSHPDRVLMSLGYQEKTKKLSQSGEGPTVAEVNLSKETSSHAIIPAEYGSKTDGLTRFFQAGFRKINPYSIEIDPNDPDKRLLGDGNNESTAFIEFVYANHWAWNPERIQASAESSYPLFSTFSENWAGGDFWDFDSRFSYNLNSSDDTTASAITGGSDISAEIGISRHLARHRFDNGSAYSIGLDYNLGVTSDRKEFDAHQRHFLGLSYNGSFHVPGAGDRMAQFSVRAGWSNLDNVVFEDPETREIRTIRDGRAAYNMDGAMAIETDLIYPIGSTAAVTFGARIYSMTDPNTWTVQIGYTKPLSELFGGLFPKSGNEPKGDSTKPAQTPQI